MRNCQNSAIPQTCYKWSIDLGLIDIIWEYEFATDQLISIQTQPFIYKNNIKSQSKHYIWYTELYLFLALFILSYIYKYKFII